MGKEKTMKKIYKKCDLEGIVVEVFAATREGLRGELMDGFERGMNRRVGAMILEGGLWSEAMDLAMDDDASVGFRAAWGLEAAYCADMDAFVAYFPRLLEDLLVTQNGSVERIYSKMLCDGMRRDAVKLTGAQAERLTEKAFGILIREGSKVATKVWQVELIADLIPRLEWIEESLTSLMRAMSENPDCTPAEAALAKNFLRRQKRRSCKP
jgi:hypothetical protein